MCGITGFYSFKNRVNTKQYYDAHIKIAHRGPDDEGFIYKSKDNSLKHLIGNDTIEELQDQEHILNQDDTSLIMGHRRLSIIDLSSHGHQPFSYENLSLVYNGEIFNYIELRDELVQNGYSFETQSDTEVFLKAYHCWGVESFNKFNGMWAAALYDKNSGNIVLTRDRFGIKPLYYSLENDNLIFGSEIKFISSFFETLHVDKQSVQDFIKYNYIEHTARTFYKNINQLEAGKYIICSREMNLQIHTYWDLTTQHVPSDSVKEQLINSVRLRMRSDVPVGTLLSGGIDSSLITGIIKKDCENQNINTFSAVFEDYPEFSEEHLIKENVAYLNTAHHYIHPTIKELENDFYDLLITQELPIRSFAIYSQYSIYKYIHSNTDLKVLLNGQGADEIFSGYSDHGYFYVASLLQSLNIINFMKEAHLISKIKNQKMSFVLFRTFKIFVKHYLQYKKHKFNNIFLNKLYLDLSFSALKEYLHYDDRNSMRFSLESRVPFLDFNLVVLAFSMSNNKKYSNGITKKILRDIGKEYIADKVLNNIKKMGFISPQEIWQKNELKFLFDETFNNIANEGIFEFIDKEDVCKKYELYKNGLFDDWHYIWKIFILFNWKKVWEVKE
jgi:asparagine synthase (glutamine-hydrolysing)